MILLINGAFGIGKTTLARTLVRRIPRSILFDPELHGIAMQRAARALGLAVDDFQDMRAWRRVTVAGLRLARHRWQRIIVPMAMSNEGYLAEIRDGISRFEPRLMHVCLVAPLAVVHARLAGRGADRGRHAWEYRRAEECCAAHRSEAFGMHVDAVARTPEELADRLIADLQLM